jgi:N6-L-threonylcarbamoyladenine synthase
MIVLGIETSCDDTAVALVMLPERNVLSEKVAPQAIHGEYGGVVPELASREHSAALPLLVEEALSDAGLCLDDVDGVAATRGPGLVGALLVGLSYAKALAFGRGLPFAGVHHVASHLDAAWLSDGLEPPFVGLVVSGGHTSLLHVTGRGTALLGATRDDAAGEAFDKVAKALGLGYPGGPEIEATASGGDPNAVPLPRAECGGRDFSFSGLKTAVLRTFSQNDPPRGQELADLCASFQEAVSDVLSSALVDAAADVGARTIVLSGGVAANARLRELTLTRAETAGLRFVVPPAKWCTDNAAMVAASGGRRLLAGERDGVDVNADPNLPLPGLVS